MIRCILLVMTMIVVTPLHFAASSSAEDSSSLCPMTAEAQCTGGCWDESEQNLLETQECAPVGTGYYSPQNNGFRYLCDPGTYSDIQNAQFCKKCPGGSYASARGQSECDICPSGTYSNTLGGTYCIPCDTKYYGGGGANSMEVYDGIAYCVCRNCRTAAPSSAPSEIYSMAPSATPSQSAVPTIVNETLTDEDITLALYGTGYGPNECLEEDYLWHNKCSRCPSELKQILFPILVTLFLLGVIILLHCLPGRCIPVCWMGLEYIQLLYLLGLTPLPWTKAFDGLLAIFSVFSFDLNVIISLQCLNGISQEWDQVWILLLPVIVGPLLWIISKLQKHIQDMTKGLTMTLYLGHTKLILTSVEAMSCPSSSWFCLEKQPFVIIGVIGMLLYGVLFPFWLIRKLYNSSKDTKSQMWRWTAFFMIRKTVLVLNLVGFYKMPSIILILFLVTLLLSELIQRVSFSFPEDDKRTRGSRFRNSTLDLIFQGCLLALTASCFLFTTSSSSKMSGRVAVTISFYVIWIPSILYWIIAMVKLSLQASDPTDESSEKPKPPSSMSNQPPTTDMTSNEALEMPAGVQTDGEAPQIWEDKKFITGSEQDSQKNKALPVEYGNDESEDTKDVGQIDYLEMVRQAWWEMRSNLSAKK